jgi:hypothetical protein
MDITKLKLDDEIVALVSGKEYTNVFYKGMLMFVQGEKRFFVPVDKIEHVEYDEMLSFRYGDKKFIVYAKTPMEFFTEVFIAKGGEL